MAKNQSKYKRKSPKNVMFSTRVTEETKQKIEELADCFEESQSEALANIVDFAYSHFLGNHQLAILATYVG